MRNEATIETITVIHVSGDSIQTISAPVKIFESLYYQALNVPLKGMYILTQLITQEGLSLYVGYCAL